MAKLFMSDEHFTVDDTLIQTWASQKSFRRKGGSDDGHGPDSIREALHRHASVGTDPDAQLHKRSYGKDPTSDGNGVAELECSEI